MENSNFYLSQIAKLYYIDKVKQNEIAKRFNITPMMVSRNLREAEQKGLVVIHVKMPWQIETELGKALMERYKLQECVVIDVREHSEIPVTLGRYLADYVSSTLHEGAVIGLSWGYTISKFVEALPYTNISGCSVIQLSGAFMGTNYAVTPTSIVQEVARKIDARVCSLNAPLYVATEELREQLMGDPTNAQLQQMAEKSDINIIGVSNFGKDVTTIKSGVIGAADFEELSGLNVIGDVAGTFIDGKGNPIGWSRSKCYTGIPLEKIRNGKNVICVAGEPEKAPVIRLAAKKRYFKTLITTKQAALALLE